MRDRGIAHGLGNSLLKRSFSITLRSQRALVCLTGHLEFFLQGAYFLTRAVHFRVRAILHRTHVLDVLRPEAGILVLSCS